MECAQALRLRVEPRTAATTTAASIATVVMIESIISIALFVSTSLTVLIILLPSRYDALKSKSKASDRPRLKTAVQIVVLGDIGRSPRMQYHAMSIAKRGGEVEIIGYHESEPHPVISSNPMISIVPLPPHPSVLQTSNKLLFLLFAPLKTLFQSFCLWWYLAYRTRPAKWLIVQNPPSIPTLAVASFVCFLRNAKLIIDWHNFGYSILALKLGEGHLLVRVARWYESAVCRYATAHLCVTNVMASVLKNEFAIQRLILPFHDRPADHFRPIADENVRRKFLSSLPETAPVRASIENGSLRVLVSSTSWTADEDFSLLLDALCRYSQVAVSRRLPEILVIITGKGPQKEMYMKQVSELEAAGKLQKVTVKAAWLTIDEYARLLASASLGVSLHTSSSGVDLPMKIVDMFGAGLPVIGWNRFAAWPELVTEGVNGIGFGNSEELASHLSTLFSDSSRLERLRIGARMESAHRWDDEWDPIVGKLLELC